MTATASISTSSAGSMSRPTSTMLAAGRISPKYSPCTRPIFSQLVNVGDEHPRLDDVREKSPGLLERGLDAAQCLAGLLGGRHHPPTGAPASDAAVVPATNTSCPTRTTLL